VSQIKSNLLVVDDVSENVRILVSILQHNGYRVESVTNGYDALRIVKEKHFDLILLDVMMPDISGIDVCRFLKTDPRNV